MAYSVGAEKLGIDAGSRVVVVTSDVRPGHEVVAAQMAWREVHRLAAEGPTPVELQQEREETEAFLEDPRSAIEEARAFAHAAVTGIPALGADELRRDLAALTVDSVREVAAALRATAVVLVPGDVEPQLPGLQPVPQWSPEMVTGRAFARKRLRGVPKEAQLIVGDDGASLLLGEDRRITVLWRDAVGLVRQGPGEWMLVGREGFNLPLSEGDWRDGAQAVALVQAAVPPELQVVDDDAQDEGLLVLRAPAYRVAEAVALGSYGATLVSNGEWTVVLPDGDRPAEAVADDLSAVVGRRTTGLVLRRAHADVEYVLLRGATEVDRHRWGLAPGDATLLAASTARPESHTSYLLGLAGPPAEVLAHAVQALGLPPEVPALLEGAEVPGQRVESRGIVGGFRASVRGDFVPPPGTGNAVERYQRLSRIRPGWFRALNAFGVLLCGWSLWFLLTPPHYVHGWTLGVAAVLSGVGLINCLLDTRPPRRSAPAVERPRDAVTSSPPIASTTRSVLEALGMTSKRSSSTHHTMMSSSTEASSGSSRWVYWARPGPILRRSLVRAVCSRSRASGPVTAMVPRWLTSKATADSRHALCSAMVPAGYDNGISHPPKGTSLAPRAR